MATVRANIYALLLILVSFITAALAHKLTRSDWLERRDKFYKETQFDLDEQHLKLLGLGRLIFIRNETLPHGNLPFWFDYELFKTVFNKPEETAEISLQRHKRYVINCVHALKKRTLFRLHAATQDTFITSDDDQFWSDKQPLSSSDVANQDRVVEFSVGNGQQSTGHDESPLELAIRVVKKELSMVESKDQLECYLNAFKEVDGSAIAGQLPYY